MKQKRTTTMVLAALVGIVISSACSGHVGGSGAVPTPTSHLPTHTVTIPAVTIPAVVVPVPTPTASTFSSNLDAFDYPPPSSPGAINTAVTQANIHPTTTSPGTICVSGWTDTIRPPASYTNALKRQQMAAEGMVAPLSAVKEDHIVPLAIGGDPTDPRNLFPQPKAGPHGATAKDRIENEIHRKVCKGIMSLADGQAVFLNHRW